MANTIVHFEIPADDVARLQDFYTGVFGWKIANANMPGMDYFLVNTVAEGEQGVNGGMMARQPGQNFISIYIGVESVDATLEKVQAGGGSVLMPKMAIPGIGYAAFVQDPQGNALGLFQDDSQAK